MQTSTSKRPVKTEGYSNATRLAKLNARRADAKARQQVCDARTLDQRMELCVSRRGQSTREYQRLEYIRIAAAPPVEVPVEIAAKPVSDRALRRHARKSAAAR